MDNNTILVIDDDRNILSIIELYLKKAGFNVATCATGYEALSVFRSVKPTLVVLDVMLPGRDGWSILNDIRQMNEEGRSFPALPCTPCSGINSENFSSDLGDCFDITSFHIQMAKGKEILLLHRLRCALYEFHVVLLETHCTNKEIPERVNQIINTLNQMICIAFGGDGCQRQE